MAVQRYTTWFRPRPVTAAAVLLYVHGGLFLMLAAVMVNTFIVAGLIIAAFAIFMTVLGSRVIRGEQWAQSVALVMSVLAAAAAGFVAFATNNTTTRVVSAVVTLGLIAIVVLLCVPSARKYFRAEEGAAS